MKLSKLLAIGAFALLLGACGKETTVTMEEFQSDMSRIADSSVSDSEAKATADKYRGDFKIVQDGKTVTKAEFEKQSGGTSFNTFLDLIIGARSMNQFSGR